MAPLNCDEAARLTAKLAALRDELVWVAGLRDQEIRRLRAEGLTCQEIAAACGISRQAVHKASGGLT